MTDGNYQSLTKAYINFNWNVFLFFILNIHFKELTCFDNLNTLVNFFSKYIENNKIDQMILKHLKTFRILMSGDNYTIKIIQLRWKVST